MGLLDGFRRKKDDYSDCPKDNVVPYKEQVKRLREAMNLSRAEFAAAMGTDSEFIYHWENGSLKPTPRDMKFMTDRCVDHYREVANSSWGAQPITREEVVDPDYKKEVYLGPSKGFNEETEDSRNRQREIPAEFEDLVVQSEDTEQYDGLE